MKNKNIVPIITGISAILIYFLYGYFELGLLNILNVDTDNMPMTFKVIYLIIMEAVELGIIITIFLPTLKKDIEEIKKNHEAYFKEYFKYWLIILGVMMVSNMIIMYLNGAQMAGNEEAARDVLTKSPFYYFVSAVLIAPLLEELIFRQGFRNVVGKNWLFVIASGFIFGGLHVITNFSSPLDLLFLIPYCTPGFVFAYIMMKTDNVLVSSAIHFMHNGILVALELFVYFFLM